MKLVAQKLMEDKRVAEAKALLLEALKDAQKDLIKQQAAHPDLKVSYQDMLQQCSSLRGGNLYYPYLGSGIGKGALVELADGSVKYDFIAGIGVHYFGHSHHDLLEAGIDAALSDTILQGHLQQNTDSLELMDSIVRLARKNGASLDHCFISTSGAMANENALKILFQKKSPAYRILCFKKCFAGRTMALAQMTDKAVYRKGIPKAMDVDYIPFYDAENPEESTAAAVDALEKHIERFPGLHAAMCMELIQGEGGYFPGSKKFFKALIAVLKKNEIAVWVDEIQTFGRLSEAFAFQYFGLDNDVDVVTIGKMSQVCATIFGDKFKAQPGLLSQTFTSSGHAIKAAKRVIDRLADGDLCGENGKNARFHKTFAERLEKMENVSGPHGLGAMVAMTVFDGSMQKSKDFCAKLFENGAMAFIAGANPVRVRFLMPVAAIEESDIHAVCDIIEKTLGEF